MVLLKRMTAATLALAALSIAGAQADKPPAFQAGVDYTLINAPTDAPASTRSDPKHIIVEEFFSYGCPHCYEFEPKLEAWMTQQESDVELERVPDSLGRAEWVFYSKVFYAAEVLGVAPRVHLPMFEAIHEEQRPMRSLEEVEALFTERAGVEPAAVESALDSFVVSAKIADADEEAQRMKVHSTPTLVVDGRYEVEVGKAGFPGMLAVADYLVDLARQQRAGKTPQVRADADEAPAPLPAPSAAPAVASPPVIHDTPAAPAPIAASPAVLPAAPVQVAGSSTEWVPLAALIAGIALGAGLLWIVLARRKPAR